MTACALVVDCYNKLVPELCVHVCDNFVCVLGPAVEIKPVVSPIKAERLIIPRKLASRVNKRHQHYESTTNRAITKTCDQVSS